MTRKKSDDIKLEKVLDGVIDGSFDVFKTMLKAGVRAKVEHPFRVIKRQFGFARVRYKGLAKNAAQIATFFALSNVWMARQHLMGAQA